MPKAHTADAELRSTLESLKAALADLAARVERLEAQQAPRPAAASHPMAAAPPPAGAPAPAGPAPDAGVTDQLVLVISAAIAAFLGERAHVRQIRLISSPAWAQQGRVSVQASHRLHR